MRLQALVLVAVMLPGVLAGQEQSPFDAIPWHRGPVTGDLGSEAQVAVPGGCLFTGRDGVKQFMDLTQNTSSSAERGVVFCQSAAQDEAPWFVVFTYEPSGYVKDDERDELDAEKILKSLRRGAAEGNKERARRGWATLTINGWMTRPYYDEATNNLTWATALRESEGSEVVVNHSVRLLGRGGVMHVDLVAGPEQLDDIMLDFEAIVAGFEFKQGHRYAEWRSGEKVAAYGLTGLIVGGAGLAAVKSGLLAKLWKVLAAGVVAVGAFFKRLLGLFGGKKPAVAARTPVVPPARPGGAPPKPGVVPARPGMAPTRPGAAPATPGPAAARR